MNPPLKEIGYSDPSSTSHTLAYNQLALKTSVFIVTALQQFPVDG